MLIVRNSKGMHDCAVLCEEDLFLSQSLVQWHNWAPLAAHPYQMHQAPTKAPLLANTLYH